MEEWKDGRMEGWKDGVDRVRGIRVNANEGFGFLNRRPPRSQRTWKCLYSGVPRNRIDEMAADEIS